MPFGENAEEFFRRLSDAPWFQRLGRAVSCDRFIAIVDRAEWRAYARHAAAFELGVPVSNSTRIPELTPLESPTLDAAPQVSAALARLEAEPRVFEPLRHVRRAAYRRVLTATRDLTRSPWLCFGPMDLRPRASESAAVAARWAVTERYLCHTGFWSEIFDLFLQGHWPYGVDLNGMWYVL